MNIRTLDPRKLEFFGSMLGIAGALCAAAGIPAWMSLAYLVWLGSSIALSYFALSMKHYYFALNQGVFLIINIIGLWRWA